MPESGKHTEFIRAGTPVTVGTVTLLPIERVALNAQSDARLWFSAEIEPYALVVSDAGGVRAMDADGEEVSLEALRKQVPALEAALATLRVLRP